MQSVLIRSTEQESLHGLQEVMTFVFSGLVLAAISIIVGGRWLSECLNLPRDARALFRIPLPGVLTLEARGNEVFAGFSAFISTLFVAGWIGGSDFYSEITERFGLALGQFNSLCVVSAFLTLIWTFLLFLLVRRPWGGPADSGLLEEQKTRLDRISEGGAE